MDILRTHPMVIIGGILQESPFFVAAAEFLRALPPWLDGAGIDLAPRLPNPAGPGTVRVVVVPIGCGRQDGVLVAGSQQTAFPSEEDRLLLSVGANQAAAVLQRKQAEEALRASEQRFRSLVKATTAIVWTTPACGECPDEQPGW